MAATNTLVQLLAPYTKPDSHNAQRHRQTDGRQDYAIQSHCAAVRSAKKSLCPMPYSIAVANDGLLSTPATKTGS